MNPHDSIDLARNAIHFSLLIASPILAVALLVGLIVGILQSLTQVQDQTISAVPKILAIMLVVSLCLPWLVEMMVDYSQALYENIPQTLSGGSG